LNNVICTNGFSYSSFYNLSFIFSSFWLISNALNAFTLSGSHSSEDIPSFHTPSFLYARMHSLSELLKSSLSLTLSPSFFLLKFSGSSFFFCNSFSLCNIPSSFNSSIFVGEDNDMVCYYKLFLSNFLNKISDSNSMGGKGSFIYTASYVYCSSFYFFFFLFLFFQSF
jgi:hypothetical protein